MKTSCKICRKNVKSCKFQTWNNKHLIGSIIREEGPCIYHSLWQPRETPEKGKKHQRSFPLIGDSRVCQLKEFYAITYVMHVMQLSIIFRWIVATSKSIQLYVYICRDFSLRQSEIQRTSKKYQTFPLRLSGALFP